MSGDELIAAWVEAWLKRHPEAKRAKVEEQVIERDVPLRFIVCGMPVLDLSRDGFLPAVGLAIARPNTTLVTCVGDAAEADWLQATLETLEVENVEIVRGSLGEREFEEAICRDERKVFQILRRSKRIINPGGRRYLVRSRDEGMTPDSELVQTIVLGQRCHVMHFIGIPEEPEVSPILKTGALLLDKIEGELKGYENLSGFLARAREAVEMDELPKSSDVSMILMRTFDGHEEYEKSGRLRDYLRAFDLIVLQRHAPQMRRGGLQTVSEGGRLLTKGKWEEPAWYSVDATPYDADYFPKAMATLVWGLGVEVRGEYPWEFVLDGVRIAARMNYRGSFSIAAETESARDKIFRGLVYASC